LIDFSKSRAATSSAHADALPGGAASRRAARSMGLQ